MKIVRCLNKVMGDCPDCTEDCDTSHHPNNLDCPRYVPLGFLLITVQPEKMIGGGDDTDDESPSSQM